MKILAVDTSSSRTAVAVMDGERVLAEDDSEAGERHGDVLLARIAEQLEVAGLPLSAIELIGVGLGPGSFTGLRVGLATAKGLALAGPVALRGVSSLEVIARGALERAPLAAVVLDAGRGEVYAALYARTGELPELVVAPLRAEPAQAAGRIGEALRARGEAVLCGGGARRYAQQFAAALGASATLAEPRCDSPLGRHVAGAARAWFRAQGASDLASVEPVYLRDSDAKLPAEPLA
jgi:tRNA threonylcarbamoyladenosine biosynthesis protein TsaB